MKFQLFQGGSPAEGFAPLVNHFQSAPVFHALDVVGPCTSRCHSLCGMMAASCEDVRAGQQFAPSLHLYLQRSGPATIILTGQAWILDSFPFAEPWAIVIPSFLAGPKPRPSPPCPPVLSLVLTYAWRTDLFPFLFTSYRFKLSPSCRCCLLLLLLLFYFVQSSQGDDGFVVLKSPLRLLSVLFPECKRTSFISFPSKAFALFPAGAVYFRQQNHSFHF